MWVIYLISFLTGCVIAWVCIEIAKVAANRDNYLTASEFKEKISAKVVILAYAVILASALISASVGYALVKENKEATERIVALENEVKALKEAQANTLTIDKF